MEQINNKTAQRIWRAIQEDWGFLYFTKTEFISSSHNVWIRRPNQETWYVERVNGEEKDWVNALLDEAGVPR